MNSPVQKIKERLSIEEVVSIEEIKKDPEPQPVLDPALLIVTKEQFDAVLVEIESIKTKQTEIDADVDEVWDAQDNMEDKLDLLAEISKTQIEPTVKKVEKVEKKEGFTLSLLPKIGIATAAAIGVFLIILSLSKRKWH